MLIASAKDDDSVTIRPFDAITLSLNDLWLPPAPMHPDERSTP